MHFVVSIAAIVLSASVAAAVVPPPNDDCANATLVGALPYVDLVDTTFARPSLGDAAYLGCGPGEGCWEATYTTTRRNDALKLKAVSD